jgi:peroxiredoxin
MTTTQGIRRRRLSARFAALTLAVMLTGTLSACGGGGDDEVLRPDPTPAPSHGGASALPGPVPTEVEFSPAPTSAAVAPPLELTLVDGTSVDAATLWKDRPVVLYFFSSWCTTCAEQQKQVNALAESYRDVVAFVGIAGEDEQADVNAYVDEHAIPFPVARDASGDLWKRYAVKEPPLVAIIGKGGNLLYGAPGEIDLARLEERIEGLLAK